MTYYSEQDVKKIIADNSPWYQKISLPYGLTTVDTPGSWYEDDAWDNAINGTSIQEASRMRPTPKWISLQKFIPSLSGKRVLEIGSNCGFFSFEFGLTALQVIGIDISEEWHAKSIILKQIKAADNVNFYMCDFFQLSDLSSLGDGNNLFSPLGAHIHIVPNIIDIIFSSTVIDHLHFPFLFIYKMLMNAKSAVILDTPIIDSWHPTDRYGHNDFLHLGVPDDSSHHGFSGTESFWRSYIKRLNVQDNCISFHKYSDTNLCVVIDTSRWQPRHLGA